MSLFTGVIERIALEGETKVAHVSVRGVRMKVPIDLVVDGMVGDTILIESGVGIAKIETPSKEEN